MVVLARKPELERWAATVVSGGMTLQKEEELFTAKAEALHLLNRVAERTIAAEGQVAPLTNIYTDSLAFVSEEARDAWLGSAEARMHLTASLLAASRSTSESSAALIAAASSSPLSVEKGQVVHAQMNDTVIVQLPPIVSDSGARRVVSGVYAVLRRYSGAHSLVVDASGMKSMPHRVLWSLVAMRETMERKLRDTSLVWLREDALPPIARDRAVVLFDLVKRVRHYFTRTDR